MTSEALFGLSVLLSFVAFGMVTRIYIWPRVRAADREKGLLPLVAPHMFRFIGLSFLVSGVVSPSLPPEFAQPVAYGDLVATLLAVVASLALYAGASFAVPVVWIFNIWGALDLLNAGYLGRVGVHVGPGSMGAAFFIPTVIVPPLLVTHGLIFYLLLRRRRK